jgi:hypothetical protein
MAKTKKINSNTASFKMIGCRLCGGNVEVDMAAVSVKCSTCVTKTVGFPDEPKSEYKPTGRPAGWHWMAEFVDIDGNVFHKGKEMPKLKGTLKPTKISKKKTKRKTKAEIEALKIKKYQQKKKAALKKLKK